MRILLIDGSLREAGYTNDLITLFREGAEAGGAEVEPVVLRERNLKGCQGCFRCWTQGREGRCFQKDDMAGLIESYLSCDTLVLASPLYFYSWSAMIKTFIERLLPTVLPAPSRSRELDIMRNTTRHPDRGPHNSVLLAVGAYRDRRNMDGLLTSYRLFADGMDVPSVGELVRLESHLIDFPAGKPITTRRVLRAFEDAGRELAKNGAISEETQANAALSLSGGEEAFEQFFESYWRIASETGGPNVDRPTIRRHASSDLRLLVPALAGCLDPQAAGDLEATFYLDFDGEQPCQWQLQIADGSCSAVEGPCNDPTVTLRCASETFVDILMRRIDPREAMLRKLLVVEGNTRLFQRFGRLFTEPAG